MNSSILDWSLYQGLFTTDQMRSLYSEQSSLDHWLQVEQALAQAQAELGMIPESAAREIAAVDYQQLDQAALQAAARRVGRPIVGLVKEISRIVGSDAAEWVHYGATTQDIMDTAAVMQLSRALDLIGGRLACCQDELERLADQGIDALMVGRTNGQHAQPITFGLKVAVWVEEFRRHRQRLNELRNRALTVQLGGAVGTLTALGEQGIKLRQVLARRLGLADSPVHWQCARDSIAEVMLFIGLVATSVSKIGRELNALASTEIAEVYEVYSEGAGSSSAMPHKRNQRGSEFSEALGHLAKQRAGGAYEFCQHEHERSGGAWIMEWVLVPETLMLGDGALQALAGTLANLVIDRDRMAKNLDITGGMVFSEEVVGHLAAILGKREAKRRVEAICVKARESGQSLWKALSLEADLQGVLGEIDASISTGLSDRLVRSVIKRSEANF